MAQRKEKATEGIREISVIDLLLFDHRFIKECIIVLSDENAHKKRKMAMARGLIDAFPKHASAEKKAVYARLESNEELHFNVLEAEIEHGIIEKKVKELRSRLARVRTLKDEVEAELKVLAELIKNHIVEEEMELLPRMRTEIEDQTLNEMGHEFMKLRGLTAKDLTDWPALQHELMQWKDSVQRLSSEFLSKVDKYVENLKH